MEKEITMTELHFECADFRAEIDDGLIKTLAQSIEEDGLLQAIVVTKRTEGGYKLIAGRRRLAACMYLGWTKISARIITTKDIDEIPALMENLQRLQMNPLEEARAVQLLHEQRGLSIRDIAQRTKHGTSWVQDRLALLSLPDNFQGAVGRRELSINSAQQLQAITDTELRDYYLHLAKVNGATISQVGAWVQEWQARQTFTGADTYGKPIPRAPGRPSPQHQDCGFCDTPVQFSALQWIPCCQSCYQLTLDAKFKTPTTPEPNTQPQVGAQN